MSKSKSIHLMLDLETLDAAPTAHVLSAALVMFNPITGEILNPPDSLDNMFILDAAKKSFNSRKQLVFGLDHQNGSTVSVQTLLWWHNTNKQFLDEMTMVDSNHQESFHKFIIDFTNTMHELIKTRELDVNIWCTGSFDLDILKNATERYGLAWNVPYWAYKDVRVARQMAETFDLLDEPIKTTHDAFDDCLRQIKYVSAVYGKLNNARSV